MSRWHRESCSTPMIIIKQRLPTCESCNSSPDLDAIVSAQSAQRLAPSVVPPDEPSGQLNLWWPPCVPYVSKTPATEVIGDGSSSGSAPKADSLASGLHNSQYASCDHVYSSQMQESQLRLVRLASVDDVDAPVHVNLEIHDDERHPDYETVSYTWGGENGDSTLCRPVYVGKYWDVLFQTQNCWEMLRYLRPRRDLRTLWVDAICINQRDFSEREKQVAKMGLIFEGAVRTVVYLGPDLVLPTSISSPYPRRHYLQRLDKLPMSPSLPHTHLRRSERVTLATLLERQYFQRIWVIQELLLSRDITFGVGDVEFTIKHPATIEPWPSESFKSSGVPWLEHVTQGIIYEAGENVVLSAVDLASDSKSTDPRDKIFGVLGMIQNTSRLAPSYSISFRHLVLGYFAYCLVLKKDLRVIGHAAGRQASANMPSWAPSAYGSGTKAPAIPRLGVDKLLSMLDSDEFAAAFKRHHCAESSTSRRDPTQGWENFERWVPNDKHQVCWKVQCSQNLPPSHDPQDGFTDSSNEHSRTGFGQHWYSHVKVDTLTGALLDVTALHILCFGEADLCSADTHDDKNIYTYVFKKGASSLLVYSQEACFESPTDLSQTHLFALCEGLGCEVQCCGAFNSRLCILQSAVDEDCFRLISASVFVCFHTDDHRPWKYLFNFWGWSRYFDGKDESSQYMRVAYDDTSSAAIPLLRKEYVIEATGGSHWNYWKHDPQEKYRHQILPMKELCGELASITQRLRRKWISEDSSSQGCLRFLNFDGQLYTPVWITFAFPGVTNPRDYLHILHAAFLVENGLEGSVESFLKLYFRLVERFEPKLLEGLSSTNKETRAIIGPETLVELCFKPHQQSIIQDVVDLAGSFGKASQTLHRTDIHPSFLVVDRSVVPQSRRIFRRFTHQLALMPGMSQAKCNPRIFTADDFRSFINEPFSTILEMVHDSEQQNIRIAFDIGFLMIWAQLHPCTAAFRRLAPYCRNGESALTLFLRDPTPEDANFVVPCWPDIINDCFGINKSARLRKITDF